MSSSEELSKINEQVPGHSVPPTSNSSPQENKEKEKNLFILFFKRINKFRKEHPKIFIVSCLVLAATAVILPYGVLPAMAGLAGGLAIATAAQTVLASVLTSIIGAGLTFLNYLNARGLLAMTNVKPNQSSSRPASAASASTNPPKAAVQKVSSKSLPTHTEEVGSDDEETDPLVRSSYKPQENGRPQPLRKGSRERAPSASPVFQIGSPIPPPTTEGNAAPRPINAHTTFQ
jgi:hypothetical protein